MRGRKRLTIAQGEPPRRYEKKQPDGRFKLMAEWVEADGNATTKTFGYVGEPEAEARFKRYIEQVTVRPASAGSWTLGSWALYWLDGEDPTTDAKKEHVSVKSRVGTDKEKKQITYSRYKSMSIAIKRHLAGAALANMPIEDVEAADIVAWVKNRLVGKMGRDTMRVYASAISGALDAAFLARLIPRSPYVRILKQCGISASRTSFKVKNLEVDELASLIEAAEGVEAGLYRTWEGRRPGRKRSCDPSPSFYARLATALGLRPGEMFGLMWADFSEDLSCVRIWQQVPAGMGELTSLKAESVPERVIDVPVHAQEALFEQRRRQREQAMRLGQTPSRFVLGVEPHKAHNAKRRLINDLRVAARNAKVPAPFVANLHTYRHTCAVALVDADVKPRDVQHWLGHADFNTTELYTRRRVRRNPQGAARLNALIAPAFDRAKRDRSGTAD